MTLDFTLDRTIEIRASRAMVFTFFTDPARWAAWWGPGSTIDPHVGGRVAIRPPSVLAHEPCEPNVLFGDVPEEFEMIRGSEGAPGLGDRTPFCSGGFVVHDPSSRGG